MKIVNEICAIVIMFAAAFAFSQDAATVTVRAKGTGADMAEALKDAYRDAIERAVGMYVDAKQAMENEEMVEDKILTQSNAYIEKFDVIKEKKKPNGLVEIQIDAEVKKSALTKKLSDIMPKQTFALGDDAQNFHSKAVTKEKRDTDAAALLANVLNEDLNPVKQLMKMTLADTKPKSWKCGNGKEKVLYRFRFTIDEAKYFGEFLPPLLKVLDQISLKPPKNIRLGSVSLYNNPDVRSPEEDKKEYIAGNWDNRSIDESGRNLDRPSEYHDADGGVFVGDIGLSDSKGNKWCVSSYSGFADATCAETAGDLEEQSDFANGGYFRVLVIMNMNAARSVVQAREYALPPECATIVQRWQKGFVGTRGNKETQTAYNIIFSDGKGEEVLATSVQLKNRTLANVFLGHIAHFKEGNDSYSDSYNTPIAWYVTPMIHCDAAAWERWIAFDITRDQMPNIKSVTVELAE